jgi:hypothetical protein
VARLAPSARRNTKVAALSDSVKTIEVVRCIEETQGARPNYPIIADPDLESISALRHDSSERRQHTHRALVFIIGPDRKELAITYPPAPGAISMKYCVIDSLQLSANHSVATPANWRNGETSSSCYRSATSARADSQKFRTEALPAHHASTQQVNLCGAAINAIAEGHSPSRLRGWGPRRGQRRVSRLAHCGPSRRPGYAVMSRSAGGPEGWGMRSYLTEKCRRYGVESERPRQSFEP